MPNIIHGSGSGGGGLTEVFTNYAPSVLRGSVIIPEADIPASLQTAFNINPDWQHNLGTATYMDSVRVGEVVYVVASETSTPANPCLYAVNMRTHTRSNLGFAPLPTGYIAPSGKHTKRIAHIDGTLYIGYMKQYNTSNNALKMLKYTIATGTFETMTAPHTSNVSSSNYMFDIVALSDTELRYMQGGQGSDPDSFYRKKYNTTTSTWANETVQYWSCGDLFENLVVSKSYSSELFSLYDPTTNTTQTAQADGTAAVSFSAFEMANSAMVGNALFVFDGGYIKTIEFYRVGTSWRYRFSGNVANLYDASYMWGIGANVINYAEHLHLFCGRTTSYTRSGTTYNPRVLMVESVWWHDLHGVKARFNLTGPYYLDGTGAASPARAETGDKIYFYEPLNGEITFSGTTAAL